MDEEQALSLGGRSNNDTSIENISTLTFPLIQPPEARIQLPMMTNLGQGMANPASSALATATQPSNPALLSSMLELYQVPPFSSLSLEQIAAAFARGSGSQAQTTPMQGLLGQPYQGVYSTLPLQRLEGVASVGAAPSNTLGNNQGSQPNTEVVGNSASIPNTDDQVAQSIETNQSDYSKVLSMPQDEENLSKYQCLLRKQIEMFQATEEDLSEKSQGRNRPIVLAQVGIRCRHCGRIPAKERARGGKFFPSNLDALYQTAQNMANTHLLFTCTEIPAAVREDLLRLRSKDKGSKTCKSAYGSGRSYWSTCLRVLGVIDTQDRRLFLSNTLKQKKHGPPPL